MLTIPTEKTTLVVLTDEQLITILKARGVLPYNATAKNTVLEPYSWTGKSGGCCEKIRITTVAVAPTLKDESFLRIRFQPRFGSELPQVVDEAIGFARTFGRDVGFTFNGQRINVRPGDTRDDVLTREWEATVLGATRRPV